ncbi:hypothetical protein J6T21_02815 [Candidatus Saccharibacteria bacterium]|nr:hypothetical protein [Candidatus Saccharibacteria bacterium]
MKKTKSLESNIRKREKVVKDLEENLKAEKAKLLKLKGKRNGEILALGDELIKLSEDFMKATFEGKDGGYPGLKEHLSKIMLRYSTGSGGNEYGKGMHYSLLFNPQKEGKTDRIINKKQKPSILGSKDPKFSELEALLTNGGMFIDGDAFGYDDVQNAFLWVFFFYLVKLHAEYEDAFRYTKHLFEERMDLKGSFYRIRENFYDML